MRIYHKSAESRTGSAWVCGYWNGSPIQIAWDFAPRLGPTRSAITIRIENTTLSLKERLISR